MANKAIVDIPVNTGEFERFAKLFNEYTEELEKQPAKWAKFNAAMGGSADAAQALTGVELFARRDQLPPPAADEFYYDDLIGLAAVTPDGATLGRVAALSNFGAGDILEVAPPDGTETLMFPFTRAVAVEIDFAGGRIVIAPPHEIDGEPPDGAA